MEPHRPVYYVKLAVLDVLLFAETFYLTQIIANYTLVGNFFDFDIKLSILIVGLMVVTLLTFSLTVGAWDIWYHSIFTPISISIGILVALLSFDVTYAIIISGTSLLLLTYDTFRSYRLKSILIKFDPIIILRFAARGLLLIFSLLAGAVIILQASGSDNINLGKSVAELVERPIKNQVDNQLKDQLNKQFYLGGQDIDSILDQYGINYPDSLKENVDDKLNVDVKTIVEDQVNVFLDPYKNLVKPLIAVLVFGLFQLYASVSYFIYSIVVAGFFVIAKKSGFLKVKKTTVEKEDLQF